VLLTPVWLAAMYWQTVETFLSLSNAQFVLVQAKYKRTTGKDVVCGFSLVTISSRVISFRESRSCLCPKPHIEAVDDNLFYGGLTNILSFPSNSLQAGDNVGLLMRGLKREDVQRGQVWARWSAEKVLQFWLIVTGVTSCRTLRVVSS
jgi:hypothetical protein